VKGDQRIEERLQWKELFLSEVLGSFKWCGNMNITVFGKMTLLGMRRMNWRD
jgi:hypothetical protein